MTDTHDKDYNAINALRKEINEQIALEIKGVNTRVEALNKSSSKILNDRIDLVDKDLDKRIKLLLDSSTESIRKTLFEEIKKMIENKLPEKNVDYPVGYKFTLEMKEKPISQEAFRNYEFYLDSAYKLKDATDLEIFKYMMYNHSQVFRMQGGDGLVFDHEPDKMVFPWHQFYSYFIEKGNLPKNYTYENIPNSEVQKIMDNYNEPWNIDLIKPGTMNFVNYHVNLDGQNYNVINFKELNAKPKYNFYENVRSKAKRRVERWEHHTKNNLGNIKIEKHSYLHLIKVLQINNNGNYPIEHATGTWLFWSDYNNYDGGAGYTENWAKLMDFEKFYNLVFDNIEEMPKPTPIGSKRIELPLTSKPEKQYVWYKVTEYKITVEESLLKKQSVLGVTYFQDNNVILA